MKLRNKWTIGLLSLGLAAVVGVSATAVYAQSATPTPDQAPVAGQMRLGKGEDHSALLAEVLGISVEELQAAMTTARNTLIDQAVADGTITQAQADAMKANEGDRGMGRGGFGRDVVGRSDEHDAALAAALGITVEELETARNEVRQQQIDAAVAAGEITQEEADLMAAHHALQAYLGDKLQTAYESAVAQAVADGVITQAQADQILSESSGGFFGPGMGGFNMGKHGMGGPGMGGPGMDGQRGGRGRGQGLNESPLAPEDATPEESSVPVAPANDINL